MLATAKCNIFYKNVSDLMLTTNFLLMPGLKLKKFNIKSGSVVNLVNIVLVTDFVTCKKKNQFQNISNVLAEQI